VRRQRLRRAASGQVHISCVAQRGQQLDGAFEFLPLGPLAFGQHGGHLGADAGIGGLSFAADLFQSHSARAQHHRIRRVADSFRRHFLAQLVYFKLAFAQ